MRRKSQGIQIPSYGTLSFKQLQHPLNFKSARSHSDMEIMNQKLNSLIDTFGKISMYLENGLAVQNMKMAQFQNKFTECFVGKMDELLTVNKEISQGISRLVENSAVLKEKEKQIVADSVQLLKKQTEQINQNFNKMNSLVQKQTTQENKIAAVSLQLINNPPITSPQFFRSIATSYTIAQNNQKPLRQYIGNFYRQSAEYYFTQYKNGKLSYQDMKIRFSYDLLDQTAKMTKQWHDIYYVESSDHRTSEEHVETKTKFFEHYNAALKDTLRYLLNKYPPSRRKIIDTELSDKIVFHKEFSITENDMLRNGNMRIGLNDNQTEFNRDIKVWINKLVVESNEQFPQFKRQMKRIFMGKESSLEGEEVEEVQYVIGRKIPEGTVLYTNCELDTQGLQIKSPEILRVLMKWCEELNSYFTNHEQKIFNNKYGFKSTKLKVPIRLPVSRLQVLSENLKKAYARILNQSSSYQKKQMGLMFVDLLTLTVEGIQQGYQQLNPSEITILKLSEHLNETLKSYVVCYLNYYLTELAKIRKLYDDDKLQSNLNLITFSVMDLLRCKCVAPKGQIYRIYTEIMRNQQYFEVIRVKNKLNESTRDILINLKLKKSFLICQIQLSLGESQEEMNDHFCHYLYELERSNFSAAFECASQICNLDPRMTYIKKQKKIKLKGSSVIKQTIKQNTHVKGKQMICSINHQPVVTSIIPSDYPYTCLLCSGFVKSNSTCLSYSKCPKCSTNICPLCIIKYYHPNNPEFAKWFITKFVECTLSITFFNRPFLQQSVIEPSKMKKQVPKYLKDHEYVMHMNVDGTGHTSTIYKKYKKTFIPTFSTVLTPKLKYSKDEICWNFITNALPHCVKRIDELKDYMKYHMTLEWADLEETLKNKCIEQVVCVVSEQTHSVLIIDIVESEETIAAFNTKKQIQKIVHECNTLHKTEIQLTSKGLKTIECINKITNKETIKLLNFWENQLENIQNIKQFQNVTSLTLRQNRLKSMSPLLHLNKLETILFSENLLSEQLPVLTFPKIRVFDVSKNGIPNVNNLQHSRLQQLFLLNISFLPIENIPTISAPKLFVLWAQGNPGIQNIDNFLKSNIPNINKILLMNCKIRTVPKIHLQSLKQINFLNNLIESLDEFCGSECPQLKIVNFSRNKIRGKLPRFDGFEELESLDLSGNQIANIEDSCFDLKGLTKLNLSKNKIEGGIPVLICEGMVEIDVSHNRISSIDNFQLSKLPHIKHLNLSHNSISNLPLLSLRMLETIDLSSNKIWNTDNMSEWRLPKTKTINLEHNKITKIPRLYLEKLQTLNISSNNVVDLEFMEHRHLVVSLKSVILSDKNSLQKYQGEQILKLE